LRLVAQLRCAAGAGVDHHDVEILAGHFGALQCRFDFAWQLSDVAGGVFRRFAANRFRVGRCLCVQGAGDDKHGQTQAQKAPW
jgi:hypothetical protein